MSTPKNAPYKLLQRRRLMPVLVYDSSNRIPACRPRVALAGQVVKDKSVYVPMENRKAFRLHCDEVAAEAAEQRSALR